MRYFAFVFLLTVALAYENDAPEKAVSSATTVRERLCFPLLDSAAVVTVLATDDPLILRVH